jgi:hypothetical protein
MPKVSRTSAAHVDDHGVVEDRHEDVAGTTISFVTIRQEVDATPLMRGLPGDSCICEHWGYVFSGRLTFKFEDRVEVFESGDAFYLPAGHIPTADAGTEYLQFSPAEKLKVVSETIVRNMQALQHS